MKIQLAESDAEILACFPVMAELRNLADPQDFLRRVRSQQATGFRLAALSGGPSPVAVAGFRLSENLAWGRHLYVDDLVTLPAARSRGHGRALLAWLVDFARAEGVGQVHLDSGTERKGAHRFYLREGFEISSFHFMHAVIPR